MIDGRRLAYVLAGTGPPVVLIHGASGNHRDWTFRLFDRIARTHTVLAVDRPGLGHSDPVSPTDSPLAQARQIRAAAARLGLARATLVGHSYGGAVALAYALQAPETVSGLLLLAAPSHVWPGNASPLYSFVNTPVVGPLFASLLPLIATDARIASATDAIFAPHPVPDGYLDHIRPDLSVRPAAFRNNAAQVGRLRGYIRQMVPRYPGLTMPIELIHGDADTIVGLDIHSVPFANRVANARLTVLEKTGHMPHHSHPDVVLAALHRLTGA